MSGAQPSSSSQPFGNPNDPWVTSSNNYSPDKFYVRATDGNGHDTVIYIKVSPALLGEIESLIQTRAVSHYRTKADFIRDACIHRLRWLFDEYPGSVNIYALEIEQMQAELDAMKLQRSSWNQVLEDLNEQIQGLLRLNELDEAEWLCDKYEYNESMTVPYLQRLSKIIASARSDIKSARRIAHH